MSAAEELLADGREWEAGFLFNNSWKSVPYFAFLECLLGGMLILKYSKPVSTA